MLDNEPKAKERERRDGEVIDRGTYPRKKDRQQRFSKRSCSGVEASHIRTQGLPKMLKDGYTIEYREEEEGEDQEEDTYYFNYWPTNKVDLVTTSSCTSHPPGN